MRSSLGVSIAYALLLAAQWATGLAQTATAPPAGEELRTAHLSWGSDAAKRCPEVRQSSAEPGAVAVVQFLVGPTGVPSQASIRSSSGSAAFDAAAVSCVLKLHYQPSTRFGDGVAVESWQQMPLKSEAPATTAAGAAAAGAAAAGAAAAGAAAAGGAGAGGAVASSSCAPTGSSLKGDAPAGAKAQPGPLQTRVGVCVCVDDGGKLTQAPVLTSSSGIAGVDKAALDLSAAARYRPATSASGQSAAGCFRFRVGIEGQ